MEPQDGDIAEDGNGNYLIFRRGRWYPSKENGDLIEPIPADERVYGPGAMELPDGTIMSGVGPRGGRPTVLRRPGENGSAPLVGADARARFMLGLGPLVSAQNNLSRMDAEGYNPSGLRNTAAAALEAIPFDGGYVARQAGGDDYNAYQQSVKTFEAAVLPIMSGAAVTPSEAQRQVRATLPQPGDSPEVLRQKSRQREMMINAVAQGIGQDAPFATDAELVGPIDPATGLPTYPTITAMTEGYGEVPIGDPNKPGRSEANAIDILDPSVLPQDLPKILSDGGWIRRGDEAPYYIEPGSVRYGSEGQQVRPGLNVEQRESAIDQRRGDESLGRRADAFVRGAADALTFGFSDEITAGLNTIAPLERGSVGGWTEGFGDAYRQNLDLARGVDRLDAEQMPLTRGAGQLAGAVAGGVGGARVVPQIMRQAPRVAGATGGANATRIAANAGRLAAGGAAGGAAYGAGSSERVQDIPGNMVEGGAIGAVVAPVAGAAVNALARPVSRIVERVTQGPNPLASAVDRYARRFKPDVNALAGRADELEALGVQPAMIDVVDDARRGTYRALATRDTPAREQAVRLAQDRRGNLPSRVRAITQEEISGETRPMMQVQEELAATRRQNAQTGSQDFNAENVRLDDNVATAMRSPVARSALTQAASVMEASLDPVERQSAEYVRRLATGEAGNGALLTVSEVQDISKALNTAAKSAFNSENPTAGPVLRDLARAIRNAGRDQSEGYRNFLRQYADDMQLEEAATTGRNFVSVSADPVNARSTEAFVRGAREATPPEIQVYQASAAQAAQAAGSRPSTARGVLEGFASDVDQQRRLAAIGANQPRVSQRSAAELRQVENAQNISPRVGSQTGTNMADQAMEAGGALREAATGNLPGLLGRAGRLIMSRGFNDREAEALIQASIDPSRTREVIEMLSQRMSRQEARNLVRSVRYMAAQQSGNVAGNDQ